MALAVLNFILPRLPSLSVKMPRYVKYFTTLLQKKHSTCCVSKKLDNITGVGEGPKVWRILNVECESIFRISLGY